MAYNFQNTYQQPLNKFDIPEGETGITGLMSGLASGYAAGKENKARRKENKTFKTDFEAMFGVKPTQAEIDMNLQSRGIKPGNFLTDYTGAVLGARGVARQEQDPAYAEQVSGLKLRNQAQQQENTLMAQLTRDAGGMVQEFGNLTTTEERLNFLKKNAAKSLSPDGARLMGQFAQVTQQLATLENKTEAAIMAQREVQEKAELIEYGYDYRRPETLPKALKNRSSMQLHKMAKEIGVYIDEPIPETLFDQDGILDYGAAETYLSKLRRLDQQKGVSYFEDPETGQRYATRGGQLLKSGVSTESEQAKLQLDVALESIQNQMRVLASDPLLRFNADERDKKMQALEAKQQTLIKQHYDSLRSRKNAAPVGAIPPPVSNSESQFQSTDSPPVIIRVAPNGRKVIYDSVTKKPLRYAD
jgi:hypothetical protein